MQAQHAARPTQRRLTHVCIHQQAEKRNTHTHTNRHTCVHTHRPTVPHYIAQRDSRKCCSTAVPVQPRLGTHRPAAVDNGRSHRAYRDTYKARPPRKQQTMCNGDDSRQTHAVGPRQILRYVRYLCYAAARVCLTRKSQTKKRP